MAGSKIPAHMKIPGVPRFALLAFVALASACTSLGYSNRVLHRVPSPNGQLVAVCQEIPILDGPDYEIRLERPNGSRVRSLYRIGDGDPCHEIVWSPDGAAIAVLSSHVARVRLVDIRLALQTKIEDMHYPYTREVSLAYTEKWMWARNLRFASADEINYEVCEYSIPTPREPNKVPCRTAPTTRRLQLPARP